MDDGKPSKSAQKREAQALQDLGAALADLSDEQLATVPLGDDLHRAVVEFRRIRSNSAKKRQRQYLGRLMRRADHDAIRQAYESATRGDAIARHTQHTIERWRDQLLEDGTLTDAFIAEYPHADRSHLRQLLRKHEAAADEAVRKTLRRQLFRWLRDAIEGPPDA